MASFKRLKSSHASQQQHHHALRPTFSNSNHLYNQNKSAYGTFSAHYNGAPSAHQLNPFTQTQAYYVQPSAAPPQMAPVYYQTQSQPYYPLPPPHLSQQIQPSNYYPNVYNGHSHFAANANTNQHQQQYMYQQQLQQQQQQQQHGLLLQQQAHYQSHYAHQQYYTQASQPQQQNSFGPQVQQADSNQNAIKSEPYVPTMNEAPYFTNAIPFKHEPKEEPDTYNGGKSSVDSDCIKIVSHLLKDKQISNQLEKVAQSFRINWFCRCFLLFCLMYSNRKTCL